MKKAKVLIAVLIIVLALALVLTACGESGTPAEPSKPAEGKNEEGKGGNQETPGESVDPGKTDPTDPIDPTEPEDPTEPTQEKIEYVAPEITAIDANNMLLVFGGEKIVDRLIGVLNWDEEKKVFALEQTASVLKQAGFTVAQVNAIAKDLEPVAQLFVENFLSDAASSADLSLPFDLSGLSGVEDRAKDFLMTYGAEILSLCSSTKSVNLVTGALSSALGRLTPENVVYLIAADFTGRKLTFDDEIVLSGEAFEGLFDQEELSEFCAEETRLRRFVEKESVKNFASDVVKGLDAVLNYTPRELAKGAKTLSTLLKFTDALLGAKGISDTSALIKVFSNEMSVLNATTFVSTDIPNLIQLQGKLVKTMVEGMNQENAFDRHAVAFVADLSEYLGVQSSFAFAGMSDLLTVAGDMVERLNLTVVFNLVRDVMPLKDLVQEYVGSFFGAPDEESEEEPEQAQPTDYSVALGNLLVKVMQFADNSLYDMGESGRALLDGLLVRFGLTDENGEQLTVASFCESLFYSDKRKEREILSDVSLSKEDKAAGKTKEQLIEEILADEERLKGFFTDEELSELGQKAFAFLSTLVEDLRSGEALGNTTYLVYVKPGERILLNKGANEEEVRALIASAYPGGFLTGTITLGEGAIPQAVALSDLRVAYSATEGGASVIVLTTEDGAASLSLPAYVIDEGSFVVCVRSEEVLALTIEKGQSVTEAKIAEALRSSPKVFEIYDEETLVHVSWFDFARIDEEGIEVKSLTVPEEGYTGFFVTVKDEQFGEITLPAVLFVTSERAE